MKRILVFIALIVLMNSCGAPKTLYYWGGEARGVTVYENLAYMDYKSQTSKATCQLICAYEDMITNPGGIRKVPPPGICAEYGYLLLMPETAETFAEFATKSQRKTFSRTDYSIFFSELGKEMLQKELEYYPESKQFIEPLMEKLVN